MTSHVKIKTAVMMTALFIFIAGGYASERVGRVCIQAIQISDKKAYDTGATKNSVFTVQIDDLKGLRVSTNASGVFTNLSLVKKHLVKIQLDGKPLTSFRFTFDEGRNHSRLWYNSFYGTWSLSNVQSDEKCPCTNPKTFNKPD
jgi:hypothetical protein